VKFLLKKIILLSVENII